ncbi:hypothetical protein F5887DRAFT_1081538 [Amanita rubescens]|nr:hypothetical protein F5887DRAFT_1081538 [Amanita rubescens]
MNTNFSNSKNLYIWTTIKRLPAPEYRWGYNDKQYLHHATVYINGEPFGEAWNRFPEKAQEDAAYMALFNPELATGFQLL